MRIGTAYGRLLKPTSRLRSVATWSLRAMKHPELCFVESGFAARYKLLRNGKRQIINLLLPGDVVGLPGSFLEKAGHSVIALTTLKLQVCPIGSYTDLCYQNAPNSA